MPMQQILLGYTTAASSPVTYHTDNLVLNLDAGDSSTWSGNTLQDQVGSGDCVFTSASYTSDFGGGVRIPNASNWNGGTFTTPNIESSNQTWEIWSNLTHATSNYNDYTYLVHNNNSSTSTGASYLTIGINPNEYYAAFNGTYGSMSSGISGQYYNSNGNSTNYHIVITWDGTTQRSYYQGSNVINYQAGNGHPAQNFSSTTTIAANNYDNTYNYREAVGTFYSLRIWNKVLTTAQIQSNFNGNKAKFGL
tara:strand:+ start:1579 stop:2328 length:750 start_codon:yes stop_codon:yes gene_type:complete